MSPEDFERLRDDVSRLSGQVKSNTTMLEAVWAAVFGQETPPVPSLVGRVGVLWEYTQEKKRGDFYLRWLGAGIVIFLFGNFAILIFIASKLR